jgi:hypothetical protein
MSHPIQPDAEDTHQVFWALMTAIESMADWTQEDRKHWEDRWRSARSVERRRYDYDREYDRASASINWGR